MIFKKVCTEKAIAGLETTGQNERYVSGIFVL